MKLKSISMWLLICVCSMAPAHAQQVLVEARAQQLDGHLTVVLVVAAGAEKHRAHAAGAELADHGVGAETAAFAGLRVHALAAGWSYDLTTRRVARPTPPLQRRAAS